MSTHIKNKMQVNSFLTKVGGKLGFEKNFGKHPNVLLSVYKHAKTTQQKIFCRPSEIHPKTCLKPIKIALKNFFVDRKKSKFCAEMLFWKLRKLKEKKLGKLLSSATRFRFAAISLVSKLRRFKRLT